MDNGEPFLSDMQISVAGAQEHSIKAWTCCPLLPNPQFSILFCTLFHTSVCPLLQTPAALIVSDISLGFQMTINAFIQIPDTSTSYLVKKKKVSDRCGSGLTFFFFLPCRFILKRWCMSRHSEIWTNNSVTTEEATVLFGASMFMFREANAR